MAGLVGRARAHLEMWSDWSERFCDKCKAQGWPSHMASAPLCAFRSFGIFTSDNWNCGTMNALRDFLSSKVDDAIDSSPLTGERLAFFGQETCMVGGFSDGFIALHIYKSRGCVDHAIFIPEGRDRHVMPLTLDIVDRFFAERGDD